MSSPYLIYRDPQQTGEYADSRLAAAEVAAEGAERRSVIKAYTDIEREKGRYNVEMLKQNVAARKNQLDNQQKTAKLFSDLQAALNKVNAQNYGNAAKAAAQAFEAAATNLFKLNEEMFAAPADVMQPFNQAKMTDPDAAVASLAGTFAVLGQRNEKSRAHGVIDEAVRSIMGEQANYIDMSDDQIAAGFRAAGVRDPTINMFLGLADDGRKSYSAGRMAEDEVERSKRIVDGLVGKEGLLKEDVDAQIARAKQALALASQQIEETWQLNPDEIRSQLVEDQRSLQEYNTLSNRSDELYELAFGARRPQSAEAELGLLLDDPEFRAWADDNNLEDIGFAIKDKNGEVVGARPGKDLAMAFHRYKYQQKNPNNWGMFGRPGGGQFTGEVVEVKYMPKDAPMAGETPDGQSVLRFGDNYYQQDDNGQFVKVDPKIAKGVDFRPVTKAGYQPLSEADLSDPDFEPATLQVAIKDNLADREKMAAVYARTKRGERVRLHASLMDEYAGKGYTAIIDDQTGQMEIISGDQLPVVRTIKGTEDSTKSQRRALRRYLSGAAAVDETAGATDKGLQRRYGGVEIRQGELEPDEQTAALMDKIAARQSEIPDFTLPGPSAALDAAGGKADKQAAAAALLARQKGPAIEEDADVQIAQMTGNEDNATGYVEGDVEKPRDLTPEQIKANAVETRRKSNVQQGLSENADDEMGITVEPVVAPPAPENKGRLPDEADRQRRKAARIIAERRKSQQ